MALMAVFACSNDNHEPYGPEYEINDMKVEVYDNRYFRDTVPADEYKLYITYLTDNEYAQRYGINPTLKGNVSNLSIYLENHKDFENVHSSNVNEWFVVDDGTNWYTDLYETIDDYNQKDQLRSLTPRLIFTNQESLSPRATTLITDTTTVELKVSLLLLNNAKTDTINQHIKTVLIP